MAVSGELRYFGPDFSSVRKRATGEGDDASRVVGDREDDAVAELGVHGQGG